MIDPATLLSAAEKILAKFGPTLFKKLCEKKEEGKALAQSSYHAYLLSLAEKFSSVRTFFDRDNGRYIYDFYVPASVEIGTDLEREVSLDRLAAHSRQSIVVGQGGSGKSVLMRHFLIDALMSPQRIPVFIELRNLPKTNLDLIAAIQDQLGHHGLSLERHPVETALTEGVFSILLDGFDEIDPRLRKQYEREIRSLAGKTKSTYILSSRPDNIFNGWDGWKTARIAPLTLEEACSLISKASFNEASKNVFVRKLREDLYTSHESFLSNPLLLSIMLLTYDHDAEIPSKLSVFYSRAFDALFTQHDALKGDYRRARNTNLDIIDFAKVFSAFSLLTYLDRKFRFGLSYAIEKVRLASIISSVQLDAESFIHDSKQAVCLLVEEGLDLAFSHRSFQEYFAARCIANIQGDTKRDFINKVAEGMGWDSVLNLLYEIDADALNELFLIPKLESLLAKLKVKKKISASAYSKLLRSRYKSLLLTPSGNDKHDWALLLHGDIRRASDFDILSFAIARWVPKNSAKGDISQVTEKIHGILSSESISPNDGHKKMEEALSLTGKHGSTLIAAMRSSNWFYSVERINMAIDQIDAIKRNLKNKDQQLKALLSN